MPQLGQYQWLLRNVFFLYATKEDALAGRNSGGTGFFAVVPSTRVKGWNHVFGVTNYHVACQHGFSVARVNTRDGKTEAFDLGPEDWDFIPNGPDVAVALMPDVHPAKHSLEAMDLGSFVLSEADIKKHEINAGDDVFMIGRFVDFDGVETNVPAMRFGHISILEAPILQENGYSGPSTIVDMHSRTGFSGSPVFVYRTHGSIFAKDQSIMVGGHLLKLLGVHWSQFPEQWDIAEGAEQDEATEALLQGNRKYIRGLSGMTCVVPARFIVDLLASSGPQSKCAIADAAVAQKFGVK